MNNFVSWLRTSSQLAFEKAQFGFRRESDELKYLFCRDYL